MKIEGMCCENRGYVGEKIEGMWVKIEGMWVKIEGMWMKIEGIWRNENPASSCRGSCEGMWVFEGF